MSIGLNTSHDIQKWKTLQEFVVKSDLKSQNTIFWKVPDSLKYAWDWITWKSKGELTKLAGIIQQEQFEKEQWIRNNELWLTPLPKSPYNPSKLKKYKEA